VSGAAIAVNGEKTDDKELTASNEVLFKMNSLRELECRCSIILLYTNI
jgi:hypothetical protein